MPTFDTIRDAHATAALAVYKATGVLIDLTRAGVTTSGLIAGFEGERESLRGQSPLEERVFLIPRQTNFSGVIDPGDVITSPSGGATKFSVTRVESDDYEAVYRVTAIVSAADLIAGAKIQSATFAVYPPGGGSPTTYDLGAPISAKLRELVEPLAIRAGHLNGPLAQAYVTQGIELEIITQDLDDNITPGAKGTITLTIKQSGGGTTTVALTGMKRAHAERNFAAPPHARKLRFIHEGPMSASPLTVV
ncbi:MAG TPA: hypothetical protein VEJ63_08920 [Planctomycetota bacterium]|nr:hypothetical protein [Planctomycetota bacterium]